MRKLVVLFAVIALALTGVFGMPLQSSAKTGTSNFEVELAASNKVVTVTKIYKLNESIPSSISYNTGGWSGRLTLQSYYSTGDGYIARYSGTVYCSGPCAMSKSVDSK